MASAGFPREGQIEFPEKSNEVKEVYERGEGERQRGGGEGGKKEGGEEGGEREGGGGGGGHREMW